MPQKLIKMEAFAEHLKSLTESDWNKLFDLQTEIERTEKFGKLKGMNKGADGIFEMPYWDSAPVVDDFLKVVYGIGLILSFDWSHWDEGKKNLDNKNQDFNELDPVTLCKLLTIIVRADRFCDGVLKDYFENGTVLRIIKVLRNSVVK